MSLMEELTGAKIIKVDVERELFLAWFGGHGIHAYTKEGHEASYWNVGNFADDNASEEVVKASMEDKIRTGQYA